MSFEFAEGQQVLGLSNFVNVNKSKIQSVEPVKIFEVIPTQINSESYNKVVFNMTLLFANTDFDYPFASFTITAECVDKSNDKIKFSLNWDNSNMGSYLFMRNLLLKDGLLCRDSNKDIINTINETQQYLQSKEFVLNGNVLKDNKLEILKVEN